MSPGVPACSQVSPVGGRETTGVWAWWGVSHHKQGPGTGLARTEGRGQRAEDGAGLWTIVEAGAWSPTDEESFPPPPGAPFPCRS